MARVEMGGGTGYREREDKGAGGLVRTKEMESLLFGIASPLLTLHLPVCLSLCLTLSPHSHSQFSFLLCLVSGYPSLTVYVTLPHPVYLNLSLCLSLCLCLPVACSFPNKLPFTYSVYLVGLLSLPTRIYVHQAEIFYLFFHRHSPKHLGKYLAHGSHSVVNLAFVVTMVKVSD